MAKRAGFWLLLFAVIGVCFGNAGCEGCAGTPPTYNAVILRPSGAIIVGSATSTTITAQVLNDSSGAGVTWATPTHGTLTAVTTTSATYNAPVVAPGASLSDTVKATSITFPNQSKSLAITVEGAPIISTTTLPDGNQGSPYTGTVNASGGVAPYSWSIIGGALPTGLSLGASTTNSVTITGTPSAQGTFNFTVQIQDSTGATGMAALAITINAPLPLAVTTTSLPNGVLNVAYPSTTLQATGGIPPFTWTLESGGLPAGLTLNSDGSITGTPTANGTSTFTVQVSDSETPAMTATSGNLSITINNLGTLTGNYTFEFSGFNANGQVVVAGTFQ